MNFVKLDSLSNPQPSSPSVPTLCFLCFTQSVKGNTIHSVTSQENWTAHSPFSITFIYSLYTLILPLKLLYICQPLFKLIEYPSSKHHHLSPI